VEEKTFVEHLEELRGLILRSALVWVAASAGCFVFAGSLLDALRFPLTRLAPAGAPALRTLSPAGVMVMNLKLSAAAGFVVAFPVVLWMSARFVSPGLEPREKKAAAAVLGAGTALFLLGAFFVYFGLLPISLRFLRDYALGYGIEPAWTLEEYVAFAAALILGGGVAFEFPVVVLGAVALGWTDARRLRRARPWVVAAVLLAAALLTPPDVASQVILAVPVLILFEICVFLARFMTGRSRAGASGGRRNETA